MESASDPASPVLLTKNGPVQTIVLNRPAVLNSLSYEMIGLIRMAVEWGAEDDTVGLLLFYGAGEKGFCAGGDIKALARDVREDRVDQALHFLARAYFSACPNAPPRP